MRFMRGKKTPSGRNSIFLTSRELQFLRTIVSSAWRQYSNEVDVIIAQHRPGHEAIVRQAADSMQMAGRVLNALRGEKPSNPAKEN